MKINLCTFVVEAAEGFKKGDRVIAKIDKNHWLTGTVKTSAKNVGIRFDTGETASVAPEDFKDVKLLNYPSAIFKTPIDDDVAKTLYAGKKIRNDRWRLDDSLVGYKIVTKRYPKINGVIITSDTNKLVSGRAEDSTNTATSIGKELLINAINLGEIRLVEHKLPEPKSQVKQQTADYTIVPARYSKPNLLIQCPSDDGWKTRAGRLADAVKGRYTNREKGYVVSPAKAKKFEQLYTDGWDYSTITGELEPPKSAIKSTIKTSGKNPAWKEGDFKPTPADKNLPAGWYIQRWHDTQGKNWIATLYDPNGDQKYDSIVVGNKASLMNIGYKDWAPDFKRDAEFETRYKLNTPTVDKQPYIVKQHIALKAKDGSLMPICNAGKANKNYTRWTSPKHFDTLQPEEQCQLCKKEIASLRKMWAKKKG